SRRKQYIENLALLQPPFGRQRQYILDNMRMRFVICTRKHSSASQHILHACRAERTQLKP
ncbi:MAG: hypothetical protein EZS28_024258, partial [Streblomastix strix]